MKRLAIIAMMLSIGCSHVLYEASCGPKAGLGFLELIEQGYAHGGIRIATGRTAFGENHAQVEAVVAGEWRPIGIAVRQSQFKSGPFSEPKIILGDDFAEIETVNERLTICEFLKKYYDFKECEL